MSVLDTLIANTDKTAYTSVWDMDKIIGVASGTINSAAPGVGPPVETIELFRTSFGTTYYFQGIFSIDNGETWNDFNSMTPDFSTPSMPVFQTLDCFGAIGSAGTLNVITLNYYDYVHSVGTARTVLWKVVMYSKNNQGIITPTTIPNSTYFTSRDRNYQKIALKGEVSFNLTASAGQSVTIPHNLGYIPKVRAFYQESSPQNRLAECKFYAIAIKITETDLTFELDANYSVYTCTGQVEFRVYYDR